MLKKTLLIATALSVALAATPLSPIARATSILGDLPNATAHAWQAYGASDEGMSAFEKQRATVMLHKLWDRFGVGGKGAALNNNTVEAYYALGLLGEQSSSNDSYIDVPACLKKLEASRNSPSFSAGTLAKYCLIVMQGTQDRPVLAPICKELLDTTDKELNDGTTASRLFTIWGAVWICQALSEFQKKTSDAEQTRPDQALFDDDEALLINKLRAQIVDYIVSYQDENGRIGDPKLGRDNQTTAQALCALTGILGEEGAIGVPLDAAAQKGKQAAAKAYGALKASQLTDGSWPYMPSDKKGDVDTTGCALKALSAYEKVTGLQTQKSKSSQLHGASFLLSTANASLDGVDKRYVSANEAMAASSAFAGLSSVLCLTEKTIFASDADALKLPEPTNIKAGSKKKSKIKVAWNPAKNEVLAADGYKVKIKKGNKVIASKTVLGASVKTATISLSKKKVKSYASKKLKAYVSSYRKQTLSIRATKSKTAVSKVFKLHK